MKFTDKYIASLKPTEKKFYVRESRGFTMQVLPSGVKTFLYIYTFEGKRKHLNLGNYPHIKLAEAREKYQEAYTKVVNKIDPCQAESANQTSVPEFVTFKHFADEFLAWSEQHHSKDLYKINRYSLNNDVLPFWKDVPLLDIRRRDAITLLERVAKRSPGQVQNVHRAARGVFDYALQRDYIEYNPLLKLTKVLPDLKYVPRERTLSEAELKTVWPNLPAHLKLILVTAQRPGEIAGLHSREIEYEWWTIPKERAEKGRGDHLVYLTPLALSLIGNVDGFIYPSTTPGEPIKRMALSRYVHRMKYFDLPRWTPHDLRRTARTMMAKIGIPDEHAEAVIAHCKRGIVGVYNKYEYQEEKKQALLRWEAELLRLIS
jgi:integrase